MKRTIFFLTGAVLILATIGLVMLFSASMVRGDAQYNNSAYFVTHQFYWMALSIVAGIVCTQIDLQWLRKAALPLAGICILLLVLVRIPGIGININGSWRWFHLGPLNIQPSEFAKIGIILAAAWWISRRRRYMHTFKRGLLPPIAGLGLCAVLLMAEPDFGTTVLIGLVVMVSLYIGGARLSHLAGLAAIGAAALAVKLMHNANRMDRITAFLHPEENAQGAAWQLINGLNAFASGGLHGVGLGNSIQKYHYLPEAHTDFILPIIGEELGLVATLIVLILFVVIFICGLRIASRASDDFGRFTALGIAMMITFQSMINLAVVTGSMPTKGLALPFISYGGSSLLVSSVMVGLLINVAHTALDPKVKTRTALFKDRRRTA